MDNLSPEQFQYSGKKYTFSAQLFENEFENSIPLDNNKIDYFEYQNTFNDLVLKGELIYTDFYGQLDRYLDKQLAYCQIYFVEMIQEYDGDIIIEKESEDNIFKHIFLIDGLEILEREAQTIKYRIKLISASIFNMLTQIDYSNYALSAEPTIFEILKDCIVQADLEIDKETFETVQTDVRLSYITNGNDTLASVTKYLLNRLFYYQTKDDSVKFIFLNETSNKVQVFDLKDPSSSQGSYSIVISVLKDNNESLVESDPVQVGSIIKCPKHQTLFGLFKREMTNYDYQKNLFIDQSISSETIYNYYNKRIESDNLADKYAFPEVLNEGYQTRHTYWNSDMQLYDRMVNSLMTDNSLIVNVAGEILRKPGAYVNLAIDRDEASVPDDENFDTYKDQLTRYIGLEGTWVVSKVRHHISLANSKYRQSLFMFRNFVSKDLQKHED